MDENEVVSRGHFWIEDASSAIAGELKYSPKKGASVYLFGTLDPIRFDRPESPIRYPVVRGRTEGLGCVCLLEALVTNQRFGTGPTSSELHSRLVIHSSSGSDFSRAPILELTAEIDCLHEWVGVSGFTQQPSSDFREIEVAFRSPTALEFDAWGDKVSFDFGRTGPSVVVVQKEVTIRQSTYVSIAFAKPKTIEKSIEMLLAVKDLIALGVGKSLSWASVKARFAVISTELGGDWASILDRPVGAPCREVVHPLEMLFNLGNIQQGFGEALRAWLEICEEVKPLYTLYSATTRGQTLYSEHRLFNFFQALESYHRTRIEVDQGTKQKAGELKEKMIAACLPEEQDWVRDKLQHLGEPSAAQRIRDLIERLGAQWIFEPNWREAVRRIKDLRNYFTHYSKRPPSGNLDSLNIYNDGSRLQVLCELILLVEIGFPASEASALLQRNCRLARLMLR